MKRFAFSALFAIAAITTSAATVAATTPVSTDAHPAEAPRRIVSLSASATEWIYALDGGDLVVAVDKYSNYPADTPITELSGFQPNLEAISTYDPDLVVLSSDRDGIVEGLAAVGIPTLVLSAPKNLAELHTNVEELGAAIDRDAEADAALAALDEALAGHAAPAGTAPDAVELLTYYWELSDSFHTVTSDTLIGSLLLPLGLVSAADGVDPEAGAYPQVSAEFVLDTDPDVVIAAWALPSNPLMVDDIAGRPGWSELTAVANGRVIVLDSDVASRWGPRVVEMVDAVAKALTSSPA